MEENFADLITSAFSDTSISSFPEGELDFEPLDFEECLQNAISPGRLSVVTEEDEQEETSQTRTLSDRISVETCDVSMTEDDEHNTDEEIDLGEDQEDATGTESLCCPGDWSVVAHCDDELWGGDQENIEGIVTERQSLALEETENPQVRNNEQGDTTDDDDDDEIYLEGGSEHGSTPIEDVHEGIFEVEREKEDDNQEDSSDSNHGSFTSSTHKDQRDEGAEVNFLSQHFPQEDEEQDEDSILVVLPECPHLAMQNLQNLVVDDVVEQLEEKIRDFLGDDHQEAGESFADYPSDLSLCEYGDGREVEHNKFKLPPSFPEGSFKAEKSVYSEREMAEIKADIVEEDDQEMDTGWTGIDISVKRDAMGLDFGEGGDRVETGSMTGEVFRSIGEKHRDIGEKVEHMYLLLKDDSKVKGEEGEIDKVAMSLRQEAEQDSSIMEIIIGDNREQEGDSDDSSEEDYPEKHNDECKTLQMCNDLQRDKMPEDSLLHQDVGGHLSKQDVGDLHSIEIIANDLAFTLHTEAGSTDLDISEDTGMTTYEELLPGALLMSAVDKTKGDDSLPWDVMVASGEGFETDIHTDFNSDGEGYVDSAFILDDKYETCKTTEEEEHFADVEDERNWEKEKMRIEAFFKFYNAEGGENAMVEERKPRVQFCMDPMSQAIQYDTDSSDMDFNSSSDEEEDEDSVLEEQSEPETLRMQLPLRLEDSQTVQGELKNQSKTLKRHRNRDRCLNMLKLILKMGLVTLMGLVMFWWATDQLDWLG